MRVARDPIVTACGVATTIARSRSGASPKSEHQVGFPAELYARSIPPDNPQTPAKIALGQALFVEQRLSADNLQHCEGCHNYALGFTDQKKTSVGIDNQTGTPQRPDHPQRHVQHAVSSGTAARRRSRSRPNRQS